MKNNTMKMLAAAVAGMAAVLNLFGDKESERAEFERTFTVSDSTVTPNCELSFSLLMGGAAVSGDKIVFCRGREERQAIEEWEQHAEIANLETIDEAEEMDFGPYPGYGIAWTRGALYLVGSDGKVKIGGVAFERHCEPRCTFGQITNYQYSADIPFTLEDCGMGFHEVDLWLSCVKRGCEHTNYAKINDRPVKAGDELLIKAEHLPIYSDIESSLLIVNNQHTNRYFSSVYTLPAFEKGDGVVTNAIDGTPDIVHKFVRPGITNFLHAANASYVVQYLVVGGGGGAANDGQASGGGGGGAVVSGTVVLRRGESLGGMVGAGGGHGARGGVSTLYRSPDGTQLVEVVARALGGGGGAKRNSNGGVGANGGGAGGNEGTRGVGGASDWKDASEFVTFGFHGGRASENKDGENLKVAGGGGGAGGPGGDGKSGKGGDGGKGVVSAITGENIEYGGGGGGSGFAGVGGVGGGGAGNGAGNNKDRPTVAHANRGGGGGGCMGGTCGGSGVIILRYTPIDDYLGGCYRPTPDYASISFEVSASYLSFPEDKCTVTAEVSADGGKTFGEPVTLVKDIMLGKPQSGRVTGLNPSTDYVIRFTMRDEHGHDSVHTETFSTLKLAAKGGSREFDALDKSGDRVHLFNAVSKTNFVKAGLAPLDVTYLLASGARGVAQQTASGVTGAVVRTGRFTLPAGKTLAVWVGAAGTKDRNGQPTWIGTYDEVTSNVTELAKAEITADAKPADSKVKSQITGRDFIYGDISGAKDAAGGSTAVLRYAPVTDRVVCSYLPKPDYAWIDFDIYATAFANPGDKCTVTAEVSSDGGKKFGAPAVLTKTLAAGKTETCRIAGLNPSSDYVIRFKITDGHGNESVHVEPFRTLSPVAKGGDREVAALDKSGDRVHFFTTVAKTNFLKAGAAPLELTYVLSSGVRGVAQQNASSITGAVVRTGKLVLPAGKTLAVWVGAAGNKDRNGQPSWIGFYDEATSNVTEFAKAEITADAKPADSKVKSSITGGAVVYGDVSTSPNAAGGGAAIFRYAPVTATIAGNYIATPSYRGIDVEVYVTDFAYPEDKCTVTAEVSSDRGKTFGEPKVLATDLVAGKTKKCTVDGLKPMSLYVVRFKARDAHGNEAVHVWAYRTLMDGGKGGDKEIVALDNSGDRVHFFTTVSKTNYFSAAVSPLEVTFFAVGGGSGKGGVAGSARTGKLTVQPGKSLAIYVGAVGGNGKSGQASVICLTDDSRKAVSEVALAKGGAADAKKIEGSDQSGDKSAISGKNEVYGGAEGNGVVIFRYAPIKE